MFKPNERQQNLLDKKLIKMSNKKYHEETFFIGSSGFKKMNESMLDYSWSLKNKMKTTPAMLTGSAVHSIVLEGIEKYESEFIVSPKFNKRTKQGKADFEEFSKNNLDKEIITEEQHFTAFLCKKSIEEHGEASQLFKNGVPEISGFFMHNGVHSKIRPDYLLNNVIIDLKTTSGSVSVNEFAKACANFKYEIQASLYKCGMEILTGEPHDFIFVVVQSVAPYNVAVFRPDDDFIRSGDHKILDLTEKYKNCVEKNVWIENKGLESLSLPGWYK